MMLRFHLTCARHQRMFIEVARRGGCFDPEKLDEVRRKTRAWLSVNFPRMVLDHFNEGSCLGCKLEANGIDLKVVERVVTELSNDVAAEV